TLEEPILRHERGAAVAQAEDGSVIFGTDVAITRAALATSDELPLPLATEGVVSFAVTAQAYDEGLRLLPSVPGLDALGKLAQRTGQADLGDAPRVHIRMTPEPGEDAAALASQVETALGALALGLTLMPTDLDGAKEALSGAEVTAKDGAVEVNAPWPYEALDRMAARLAERIRAARSQRAASP
ncbi:MAG: hypothetical protein KC731_41975, partial [Myxococcales bacterium]|nr:hypothetical protein [Myxococcales bacterium]